MRTGEVPQEGNKTLNGERKALYAVDETGQYRVVASRGWEVEEIVTSAAVEEYDLLREQARQQAFRGEVSSLEFHMYARRFRSDTLAQATGLFHWRVKRHLRPEVFARLNPKLLQRYADALGIPVAYLCEVPRT